jgi:hypothetical protein
MMTDAGAVWPKNVRRMVESVQAEGFEPEVRKIAGEWEVFIAGDHVRAAAFYGAKPGSPKTRYLRGELWIDGVEHPRTVSFGELHDVWDKHELSINVDGLLEVTDPGPEAVPLPVRLAADGIRRGSGGRLVPRCGRSRRRWVVAVDFGPGTGIRMLFDWDPEEGEWCTPARNPVQLYIDGEDRSAELEGKIDRALALLAARPPMEAGAAGPGMGPSPSARDNGVETRRMVVKRELPPAGSSRQAPFAD